MLQKIIYSMPSKFMEDESVPVKWRLYGIINGFWINGLKVYAANKFFSDKLNCAERTIAFALQELEGLKLVTRKIHGHNRTIHPYGFVSEGAAPLQGGSNPAAGAHATQSQPNASSIAPSITVRETRIEKDSDSEGREKSTPGGKTTPAMKEVFEVFDDNPARKTWKLRVVEREAAQVLHDTFGVETLRKRYSSVKKHRNDPMCPQINKPSDFLDKMPNMEKFMQDIKR